MKIIEKETGKTLGTIVTNRAMTIYEACDIIGLTDAITPDDNGECQYNAEIDIEMVY